MKQEKIEELAKYLGEVPQYVGYRKRDEQVNLGEYESKAFDTPAGAFAAAKLAADGTNYTRLEYGVRAELGPYVVVTEVDGYTGIT